MDEVFSPTRSCPAEWKHEHKERRTEGINSAKFYTDSKKVGSQDMVADVRRRQGNFRRASRSVMT